MKFPNQGEFVYLAPAVSDWETVRTAARVLRGTKDVSKEIVRRTEGLLGFQIPSDSINLSIGDATVCCRKLGRLCCINHAVCTVERTT